MTALTHGERQRDAFGPASFSTLSELLPLHGYLHVNMELRIWHAFIGLWPLLLICRQTFFAKFFGSRKTILCLFKVKKHNNF